MMRPADMSLDGYARMAEATRLRAAVRRAIERDGWLTRDEDAARGVHWPTCMTGDGNPTTEDTALCRACRARPYGTVGPLAAEDDRCSVCWTPHLVWLGNVWAKQPTEFCGSPLKCRHACHDDEVWLASA